MTAAGGRSAPRGRAPGLVSITAVILLAAAAIPALGIPEFPAAGDFMTSGRPSRDGAIASVQVVVWLLVFALLMSQLVHALRRPGGDGRQLKTRRTRSRAAFVLGILIFGGGVLHSQYVGSPICCGDLPRAERALH